MKVFIRIIRVILGLALLAAFAYGLFTFAQAAPKSGDYKDLLEDQPASAPVVTTPKPAAAVPTDAAPAGESPAEEGAGPAIEQPPEPTPLPNTPAARAAALGLPAPPNVDINSWEFLLVNGDHSIDQYAPEQFGYINPTIDAFDVQTNFNPDRTPVDFRIAQALLDFGVAAEEEGLNVYLASGYRSYESQVDNFNRVCANNGVSDGKNAAGYYITMPAGCSEHQSGLCCDITDRWYGTKTADALRDNPLSVWMAQHCQEYGFILRFPEGKEDITKVMYEPWHFRYVGVDAATYIMANNLTLEEFVGLYA